MLVLGRFGIFLDELGFVDDLLVNRGQCLAALGVGIDIRIHGRDEFRRGAIRLVGTIFCRRDIAEQPGAAKRAELERCSRISGLSLSIDRLQIHAAGCGGLLEVFGFGGQQDRRTVGPEDRSDRQHAVQKDEKPRHGIRSP
ncbi:MAG: hypothetical protein U0992_00025 [Planctomycetaceae bacterium]